ncbi:RtcB family protein [Nitrospinota bacterium]
MSVDPEKPLAKPLEIRGHPVDPGAERQIRRCLEDPEAASGALCADHHLGYSMPIGGVIAYRRAVSPSGVGYDIACGNKAVRTNLSASAVRAGIVPLMDEIFQKLEFGMGRRNPEPVDHALFDDPAWRSVSPLAPLKDLARSQLGTIGSGNHYVDLFEDEEGVLWVGVHFGSRGFGHKLCTGFLNLAKGRSFADRPRGEDMNAPATVFPLDTPLGSDYMAAMTLAGRYAYAGRDYVCTRILEILGARAGDSVHNHHNFAWEEEHGGERFLVVRKGATPAWPGQRSFIGGTMGGISVIAEGVDTPGARRLLRSTVHGAGRVMSRTAAAGRKRWRGGRMIRKGGRFTRQEMNATMKSLNICLRGADTDEDPRCYKKLEDVLARHDDALKVLTVLHPIGVAMAGADVRDDFRD